MRQYLDLLRRIRDEGKDKHPTRVESGYTKNATIGLPNLVLHHDLADGFPLLTTREINWKACVGELRSFLLGHSNHRDFRDNGCGFWKPWARPDGDLGPIYGVQWNRHGQLAHVLDCLHNSPTNRRMVVSAWRPDEHADMVLPPCHLMWVITPYDDKLNLAWIMRSCDFPIGVPYNIASYALLAHVLAAWAGMDPGCITCTFCDAHIYVNQLAGVNELLHRTPDKPPTLSVWFSDNNDFYSWKCELRDWHPQPNIGFGTVEV